MKKILSILLVLLSLKSFSKDKEIIIVSSEPKATIYANGNEVGIGTAKVKVIAYSSVVIEVKCAGFLDRKVVFYNDNDHPKLDKSYTISLFKDESFEASVNGADVANENININSSKDEDKAWKVVSEVVTNVFDILEVSDKSTGYIRTGWNFQSFGGRTIRTRIIVKGTSTENKASYKIKLISEIADKEGANVKDDDLFKPWDRILKKYSNVIPELQERLK